MPNAEAKIDPKAAKGAVAGATVGLIGEKSWKAENNLRNVIRAAEKAGVGRAEIERLVGASILSDISPEVLEPKTVSPAYEDTLRGMAGVLSKIGSGEGADRRLFMAGFVAGLDGTRREDKK